VTVDPPGSVVVPMGVDDTIGVEVVGVGVVLGVVLGVLLDVVGGGELEVVNGVEVEGLGVKEEEVMTEEGLLLAIELVDGGSEELVGDEGEVDGTPASVLEVELVDIVNCLLNTSFLGCLDVAMSAEGTLHGCAASSSTSIGIRTWRIIPQALVWVSITLSSSDSTQVVWVVSAEASLFRVWKERRTCSGRAAASLSVVGRLLRAALRPSRSESGGVDDEETATTTTECVLYQRRVESAIVKRREGR